MDDWIWYGMDIVPAKGLYAKNSPGEYYDIHFRSNENQSTIITVHKEELKELEALIKSLFDSF